MNNRSFENWFLTFKKSINGYRYYTDFEKVYRNVDKLKVQIHILNSLVGSKDIEKEFENILTQYPECLKVVPLLLAVRNNEIFCRDEFGETEYKFDKPFQSVKQYKYFMRQTGLFDLLENHCINSVYDYLTGVEVGLDSNARKNRGGHQMEDIVKFFLEKSGFSYYQEMYLDDIEKRWDYDLSPISSKGTSTKRWDFVVKTSDNLFAIETNFYTDGGSKLNETARSYKMIAEESAAIKNFTFVWITDGEGWKKAKRNLKETFLILPTLYNIHDLENGIFLEIFKQNEFI